MDGGMAGEGEELVAVKEGGDGYEALRDRRMEKGVAMPFSREIHRWM